MKTRLSGGTACPTHKLAAALRYMGKCTMDFAGSLLEIIARASWLPDPSDPIDIVALTVNGVDLLDLEPWTQLLPAPQRN